MNLFQRYMVEEFAEDYVEGRLPRRAALKMIASVTGSFVAAETFLAGCAPARDASAVPPSVTSLPMGEIAAAQSSATPSAGATAIPGGGHVVADGLEFAAEDGARLFGYVARPPGENRRAVVLVCHENRGLTDHIRDVARRLAGAGYIALAVDLLSRHGGTDSVGSENVPGMLAGISPDRFVDDFRSGWDLLRGDPSADADQVGMVGFCFGGGVTWLVATRMSELRAAVPFYGPHPPLEDVPRIQAPVLAIYAGNDQRINQGIPAIEAAMQEHGKVYEKIVYPGVDHAFHNDTGPRYNAEAAQDAWRRTLEWFGRYLA
jgi:carboxymethylenebutenolidase